MEKIHTYEQYDEVLADFKKGKAKCSTNKIFMRDELTALIDAGKLFYQEIDGTLWFFSNEGYFYRADFFVPADIPIRLHRQDMAVLTELTGSETRYNVQWEQELIAAGYEKRDKDVTTDHAQIFVSTAINSPMPDHIYLFRSVQDVVDMVERHGFVIKDRICAAANNLDLETAERKEMPITIALRLKKKAAGT